MNGQRIPIFQSFLDWLLLWTAYFGLSTGVKGLLQLGANPQVVDSSGDNALLLAIRSRCPETVDVLIRCEPSLLSTRDRWGLSTLVWAYVQACEPGRQLPPEGYGRKARSVKIFRDLLQRADVSRVHGGVLNSAIRAKDLVLVDLCLAYGMDAHFCDAEGKSALEVASESDSAEIRALVLAKQG